MRYEDIEKGDKLIYIGKDSDIQPLYFGDRVTVDFKYNDRKISLKEVANAWNSYKFVKDIDHREGWNWYLTDKTVSGKMESKVLYKINDTKYLIETIQGDHKIVTKNKLIPIQENERLEEGDVYIRYSSKTKVEILMVKYDGDRDKKVYIVRDLESGRIAIDDAFDVGEIIEE